MSLTGHFLRKLSMLLPADCKAKLTTMEFAYGTYHIAFEHRTCITDIRYKHRNILQWHTAARTALYVRVLKDAHVAEMLILDITIPESGYLKSDSGDDIIGIWDCMDTSFTCSV